MPVLCVVVFNGFVCRCAVLSFVTAVIGFRLSFVALVYNRNGFHWREAIPDSTVLHVTTTALLATMQPEISIVLLLWFGPSPTGLCFTSLSVGLVTAEGSFEMWYDTALHSASILFVKRSL